VFWFTGVLCSQERRIPCVEVQHHCCQFLCCTMLVLCIVASCLSVCLSISLSLSLCVLKLLYQVQRLLMSVCYARPDHLTQIIHCGQENMQVHWLAHHISRSSWHSHRGQCREPLPVQ